MSTLWIWTPQRGIEVIRNTHPHSCEGAKAEAAALLGRAGSEDELCCHSFDVDNHSAVGKQTVFLVWVCEDYEMLMEFLKTSAGASYADSIGEIPPPFGLKF